MTTHEAARIAGVTPTTIRRWIAGNLHAWSLAPRRLPHALVHLGHHPGSLAAAIADAQDRAGRTRPPPKAEGESHDHLQRQAHRKSGIRPELVRSD